MNNVPNYYSEPDLSNHDRMQLCIPATIQVALVLSCQILQALQLSAIVFVLHRALQQFGQWQFNQIAVVGS